MAAKKDAYHHGDLRRALLSAGLALLEERGLEGLTLRRVAAAAGVSHAAPAHYFPSLKSLLTALAAIGFERFGAAMTLGRQKADKDPAAQMRAAGQAYVDFAIRNPGLFRLMFSQTLLDWSDSKLCDSAQASFRCLEEIVRPLSGKTRQQVSTNELIKLVWCVVHGYANLYIQGQMQWVDGAGADAVTSPRAPDVAALLFQEETERGSL